MRPVLKCLAFLASASLAFAADPPPKQFGRDRLVDLLHARIELSVDIPRERVEGSTQLTFTATSPGARRLEVDAVNFEIRAVTIDGREAAHDYDGERLGVAIEPPLGAGESRVLRVEYSAEPRNGLYFVHGARRDQDQCWSQGETEENRHWFPVHDDPSERLTSETLITVPQPLSVVSNGPLLSVTDAGAGRRTFHHRLDFPHVPYLVSIAVGDWATQREEWEGIELTHHAPKDRAADMARTYGNTARILAFLSKETGVKYPYPVHRQVAVSEYIWGGMENIAATTLTDQTLHDERAHSDWTSDSLVAHEAAHQWFGDYVTCKDWGDIWLNEGFATYYGALSMGELLGPDQLVVELDSMRASAISADAGAARRPVVTHRWNSPADLFGGHAYAKGGMILHALRRELGDDAYRRSVKGWLERFAGRSANTADFLAVIEEVTGRDVSRFFDQWLHEPGHPVLDVSWKWRDGDLAVTVKQAQGKDGLFDIPLDLQAIHEDFVVDEPVRVRREEETFHFAVPRAPRAVLADPQGHLLRTLKIDRKTPETAFVLRHASHLLPRLEAARALKDTASQREPLRALADVASATATPWALRREAASALELSGSAGTPALLRVLHEDPDSRVRTAAAAALARHRTDDVRAALLSALSGERSYAVRAAAARSLSRFEGAAVDRALEAATLTRSHREEVLAGALEALSERRSPRLRAVAERLSADSQPYPVRLRAVSALGRVARDAADDAPTRRALRERLEAMLEDRLFRIRMDAADALVTAEDGEALPALKRMVASHPHDLTRDRGRAKVLALESKVAERSTLADLRRAVEDERRKREELEARVRELEARLPGAGDDDGKDEGDDAP